MKLIYRVGFLAVFFRIVVHGMKEEDVSFLPEPRLLFEKNEKESGTTLSFHHVTPEWLADGSGVLCKYEAIDTERSGDTLTKYYYRKFSDFSHNFSFVFFKTFQISDQEKRYEKLLITCEDSSKQRSTFKKNIEKGGFTVQSRWGDVNTISDDKKAGIYLKHETKEHRVRIRRGAKAALQVKGMKEPLAEGVRRYAFVSTTGDVIVAYLLTHKKNQLDMFRWDHEHPERGGTLRYTFLDEHPIVAFDWSFGGLVLAILNRKGMLTLWRTPLCAKKAEKLASFDVGSAARGVTWFPSQKRDDPRRYYLAIGSKEKRDFMTNTLKPVSVNQYDMLPHIPMDMR